MRTSTIHRRQVVVLGLAFLLALSAVMQIPRARATDPLTVTASCDVEAGLLTCTSNVTGGTGEYTYNWKSIQNATFDSSVHSSTVFGSCVVRQSFAVKLVVKDSAGAKANSEDRGICSVGPGFAYSRVKGSIQSTKVE